MTQKLNIDNGFQGRWTRTSGYNSTYKKLVIQWFNEALCPAPAEFSGADSFNLRNSQRFYTADHCKIIEQQ